MRVDYFVGEEFARLIHYGDLAASAEAGIDTKHGDGAAGRCEQQVRLAGAALGADEIVRDGKSLAAAGGADVIFSTSNSTKSMVDSQGRRPDGRLVAMGAATEPLSISLTFGAFGK
jgi:hypothetical protein